MTNAHTVKDQVLVKVKKMHADVAKLADAQVSGSCGQPCGFKSLRPHQKSCIILIQLLYKLKVWYVIIA